MGSPIMDASEIGLTAAFVMMLALGLGGLAFRLQRLRRPTWPAAVDDPWARLCLGCAMFGAFSLAMVLFGWLGLGSAAAIAAVATACLARHRPGF